MHSSTAASVALPSNGSELSKTTRRNVSHLTRQLEDQDEKLRHLIENINSINTKGYHIDLSSTSIGKQKSSEIKKKMYFISGRFI